MLFDWLWWRVLLAQPLVSSAPWKSVVKHPYLPRENPLRYAWSSTIFPPFLFASSPANSFFFFPLSTYPFHLYSQTLLVKPLPNYKRSLPDSIFLYPIAFQKSWFQIKKIILFLSRAAEKKCCLIVTWQSSWSHFKACEAT